MKNHFKLFLTKSKKGIALLLITLFSVLCSFSTYAQVKKVTGTITDEIGMPLPGANVIEKGTQNGAVTDFDGNFSILVSSKSIITVSYIGYKPQEITVGNQSVIQVKLLPDLQQLEETVVIGYGSVRKKDLTGSVASVKMEKLTEAPVVSFDQALAGRVSGVQVAAGDGEPGSGMQITIRGANTVNGDNSPLYVLDGFIVEDFNPGILDPTDIQSIDILKDASATAIYGARGANGVVLITSKTAKSGKTKMTYETRLDVKEVTKKIPVLNAYEFVRYINDLEPDRARSSYFVDANGVEVGSLEDYENSPTRNWQDEGFRTAYTKSHKLNISSGGESTRFTASLNALNDEGTLLKTEYKRLNGRINMNHKINDKADVTTDVLYSNSVQQGLDTEGTGTYSFMRGLISYQPVVNKFIDYGDFSPLDGVTDDFQADPIFNWHPIQSLNNEYRNRKQDQFISNIKLRYKLNKNLTLEVKGGYNGIFRKNGIFNNSKTVYGRLIQPINGINGSMDHTNFKTLTNINTLTFRKTFGGKHYINALIGTSVIAKRTERTYTKSTFIPEYAESLGINALDEGELSNTDDFNGGLDERTQSLLARFNYTYNDKYLLTTSIRRDGSSKFSPGNNISYFPSIALAWKAEEESFIKKLDWISQLKFKVGYGKTGNDRIPSGARFDLFTSVQSSYFIDNGSIVLGQRPTSTGANPNLVWETTSQYNAGIDLGLFKGRVSASIEAYQKTTDDLLLLADKSPSVGISDFWINSGSVRNRGLEVSLNTINVKRKHFQWTSDFNISFNQNVVTTLPENKPIFGKPNYYSRYSTQQYIVEEGKSLGNMYGYISDGVYQNNDFTNGALNSSEPSYKAVHQPGDEKYKDLNGDGRITPDDKTIIGNGLPKHFGGLGNTFTYKNFDLSIFFQWSYGNDVLNANRLVFEEMQVPTQNQYATVLNRWSQDNQNTDMFRAGGRGFEDVSSRVIEDGSYVRLKTINFSYTVPKNIIEKLPINSLKLYASGQNLFTWTNYSGFDPDVSTNRSPIMPGIDYSAYPINKIYSLGLNVTF